MALVSRPHVGHGCQRTVAVQRSAFRPFSGRRPSPVAVAAAGEEDAAPAEGSDAAPAVAAVDTDSFSFNLNE